MRHPHRLAAQQPSQQRHRGVEQERRENQKRKPGRPYAASPAQYAQDSREETERNRACIAQEDAGRREIPHQEAERGTADDGGCGGQIACTLDVGGDRVGTKTADRHASRKPVCAIHEVVRIQAPDDARNEQADEQQCMPGTLATPQGKDRRCGALDGETDANSKPKEIVDEEYDSEPGRQRGLDLIARIR